MSYELISWRPDLRNDVASLHAERWGGVAPSADYLAWKFEHNPYIHDPLMYLAARDGKIIGMRGAYGTLWEVGPERRKFCLPCLASTILDPAHRDRGLFSALTAFALRDLAERGYPYAVNMSAGALTSLGQLAGGWRGIGRQVVLARRSRVGILRRKAAAPFGLGHDPFAHLDRLHGEMAPRARAELGDGLRHVRDTEYFEWRLRCPRASYRMVGTEDEWLVLSARRGSRSVEIADWNGADTETLRSLVRDTIREGRFASLKIRLSDEYLLAVVRELGFEPVTAGRADLTPALFVRPTADVRGAWGLGGVDIRDPDAWRVRTLDTDLV